MLIFFPEPPAVFDYPLKKGEKGLTGTGEDVLRRAKNTVTLFNHQHFTHLTEMSLYMDTLASLQEL